MLLRPQPRLHLLHPRADRSNLGLLGGLLDHPLSWTDDANRFLLALQVVLFPGRFVAESLVDGLRLLRRTRTKGWVPPDQRD